MATRQMQAPDSKHGFAPPTEEQLFGCLARVGDSMKFGRCVGRKLGAERERSGGSCKEPVDCGSYRYESIAITDVEPCAEERSVDRTTWAAAALRSAPATEEQGLHLALNGNGRCVTCVCPR